jgi:hypothetical protein
VFERELDHAAIGKLAAADGAQVALEAPHHHRVAGRGRHGDAAREALRVEDFEERGEGVGVPVVRRRGEKQSVLEARRHVADHLRDARVDGVARGGGGRGGVGLVEDEQRLAGPLAEVGEQRVAVLGAAQRLVRDDEAGVGGPGVDAEAALLPPPGHKLPVVDLKLEPELALHLVAPLERDRRRAHDERLLDALAQQQLLEDEARLDGLAEAHVVGDEQVGPGHLQRPLEGRELVVEEPDARAKGRLEEARVGGGDGVPAERVEVGGEVPRRVEARDRAEPVRLGREDAGAELVLPEDGEGAPLRVVVEAHHRHAGGLAGRRAGRHLAHEVLPVPRVHDVPAAGQGPGVAGRGWGEGLGGGAEDARGELGAPARTVVEVERAADGAELVASKAAHEVGSGGSAGRSASICASRVSDSGTSRPSPSRPKLREPKLRQRREHRCEGRGRPHGRGCWGS